MFRRVQDNLTAAQGANLLYQQAQTTSKISFKTENGSQQPLPTRWLLRLAITTRNPILASRIDIE